MPATLDDLLELMRRLRDPELGCPWDRAQTPHTLTKFTLEEAYEVTDVIERGALAELPSELGDLLFQVVFYAQIGTETGQFTFADVVDAIYQKLWRRHPHVFGDAQFGSTAELNSAWEAAKAEERIARGSATSELDDVPLALPALTRAFKLQKRASRVGFDWPTAAPIVNKIREELDELTDALTLRQTRRSDVAFWLHLLAAPLLVHPIFTMLGVTGGKAGLGQALAVVVLYVAIALVSLAVDRRALMVSALTYVLFAFTALLKQFGVVSLGFAITALAIGAALLLLSAFWHPTRAFVLGFLPPSLQQRLAPFR